MGKKHSKFTADFETANSEEIETYIWAWAICDIETERITIGNSMESFLIFCQENPRKILFS